MVSIIKRQERYDKRDFNYEKIESQWLSQKDYLRDFETLYNVLSTSITDLPEAEKLFDFKLSDKYEKYKIAVAQVHSDVEFYCLLYCFTADIPSIHTTVFSPDFESTVEAGLYNIEKVATEDNLKGVTEYWKNTLEKYFLEYKFELFVCDYKSGEYILRNDTHKTLIAVDGIDVHEYAKNLMTVAKIQYDFINNRPYRYVLIFNETGGTPVTLTIRNEDGSLFEKECYVDMVSEFDHIHGDEIPAQIDRETEANDKTKHYSITHIDDNNYYVAILDFSNSVGIELYRDLLEITSTGECNIILDLRNNGGGLLAYAPQFVYPPLFQESVNMKVKSIINHSKNNNKLWYDFIYRKVIPMEEAGKDEYGNKRFMMSDEYNYNAEATFRHNIYVLVGEGTVSAADTFTAAAKQNDNAVIIGTNTAGEGTQAVLFAEILPKSKLVYLYNPAKSMNPDGTSNSIYGTTPDIYAAVDRAGYTEMLNIIDAGNDPYTFEKRMKWDNVLLSAIQQIEEQSYE
jgi:RNAse (barnase) inhibitor barstar